MSEPAPVRIGLVGAGPWAGMVHAPVFAAGPETTLSAVWARRPEAAQELASKHEAKPVATLDELFELSDAVAFCVPPAVQADLAMQAARAGKALILEKPIAGDVAAAERLADAIDEAGVRSLVVLSWRYSRHVRAFLDEASSFEALGGRGTFIGGGFLDGPFRTPWRLENGPLLDLGPHIIDLLDAALGTVVGVRAAGRADRWTSLLLEHENGLVSEASTCAHVPLQPHIAGVELFGESGSLTIDCVEAVGYGAFKTLREEAAEMVRSGDPHFLDVRRGLHLQRIIDDAYSQLG
jgi:predicted dehydrogenase